MKPGKLAPSYLRALMDGTQTQELIDDLGPGAEESRSLYRHVADELELAKAANRGLLQQLRECRAAQKRGTR